MTFIQHFWDSVSLEKSTKFISEQPPTGKNQCLVAYLVIVQFSAGGLTRTLTHIEAFVPRLACLGYLGVCTWNKNMCLGG